MILPVTPEQLAKALIPGLQAITRMSIETAILAAAKEELQRWIRQTMPSSSVTTSVNTEGKLVFLIEVDAKDLK